LPWDEDLAWHHQTVQRCVERAMAYGALHEPASDINTVVVDSLKRLTRNGRLEKRTLNRRTFAD
jgi:hypothetical protein